MLVQSYYVSIIAEQTKRAMWEVKNVIDCVPDDYWCKCYCEMPLWKHIYHMLHSLDLWFINPRDRNYKEPPMHEEDLNNLDAFTDKQLTRSEINNYLIHIENKIEHYLYNLNDSELLLKPDHCEYTRFTLILAQHRHLHTHMGMIMGFLVDDTQKWPRVLGLEGRFPQGEYDKYF